MVSMDFNDTRGLRVILKRIADALEKQNELLAKIVEKEEKENEEND